MDRRYLGASAAALLLLAIATVVVVAEDEPQITRELPAEIYPGETLIVSLTTSFDEPQSVTVVETIEFSDETIERTVDIRDATADTVYYTVPVPEDHTGPITVTGEVQYN